MDRSKEEIDIEIQKWESKEVEIESRFEKQVKEYNDKKFMVKSCIDKLKEEKATLN